jgi:nitroreductase
MKTNYKSWYLKVENFPDTGPLQKKLEFLVRFAVLAPSAHNTQPWSFSINNNSIFVFINNERALKESDPVWRQVIISLGCAIQNILIAADYYGFQCFVDYFPNKDNRNLVAKINFIDSNILKNDFSHLIFSILKRRTNRNKYDTRLPTSVFLDELRAENREGFGVVIVSDRPRCEILAQLALISQIETMDQDFFREELSRYIKSNLTREKIGMPGFTLGIPTPVSFFASRLIRKINLSRKTQTKDEVLLMKYTSAFGIVFAPGDSDFDRVKAGELLQKAWLLAEKNGLSCAPLAAPVQIDEYCKKIQEILHFPNRPLAFFRLGYALKSARHSPRLGIDDILIRT